MSKYSYLYLTHSVPITEINNLNDAFVYVQTTSNVIRVQRLFWIGENNGIVCNL